MMAQKADRAKKITEILDTLAARKCIWGYSLALTDREKASLYYHGVTGRMAPYNSRIVEEGLSYDLASLTKVVGTVSRILQLVDNKTLDLNMEARSLLPDFKWKGITIGSLLLHNSGLPAEIPDKQSLTRDNILERLYEVKPEYRPGERFVYSDVGYILLGLIIQHCADDRQSLDKICRTYVFDPLGMNCTSYQTDSRKEQCIPTEVTKERGIICGQVHDRKAWLLGQSGSAGLFSTLEDVTAFVQAYLKEDPRLFSPEIFRLIFQTNIFNRTFGWSKEYGTHTLYHTGFTGTSILMDLDRREAMVLLTNRIHPSRDNQEFLEERKNLNQIWLR